MSLETSSSQRIKHAALSCFTYLGFVLLSSNSDHKALFDLSNEKKPGCSGCIGGYTTLCYRVYYILLYIGIPIQQPV